MKGLLCVTGLLAVAALLSEVNGSRHVDRSYSKELKERRKQLAATRAAIEVRMTGGRGGAHLRASEEVGKVAASLPLV
jgi:hypothetical protein